MLELKTNYREVKNEEKNGVELYFDSIPTYEERKELKNNNFKWHNIKKCWYRKNDIESQTKTVKDKKINHSLKVGDILEGSWGYEQTNNSFYRVESLVGATMVKVREVYLAISKREATGPDAENRIYNINDWSYANNKEYTKKVKNYYQDKRPDGDFVSIEDFINASKYNGEKIYCSWYY